MAGKSIAEVNEIVEMEGLGYALEDYLNEDEIEDGKLAELWGEARGAIAAVREFLNERG